MALCLDALRKPYGVRGGLELHRNAHGFVAVALQDQLGPGAAMDLRGANAAPVDPFDLVLRLDVEPIAPEQQAGVPWGSLQSSLAEEHCEHGGSQPDYALGVPEVGAEHDHEQQAQCGEPRDERPSALEERPRVVLLTGDANRRAAEVGLDAELGRGQSGVLVRRVHGIDCHETGGPMRALLEQLLDGHELTEAEADQLLDHLQDPEQPDVWKAAALAAMRTRGETAAEVRAFARGLRARAVPFDHDGAGALVDTCGTGGDGSNSINISTAAALVVAAMGHPVVKHGNRSVSSKSGSADVLEALGLDLPEGPKSAARMLEQHGFTFLFAPHFHPATAGVMPVRRALKTRTIFNVLGPLSNPARPPYQLVGAYSSEAAATMADALAGMAIKHALVVHGAEGWDEATPLGPFEVWDVRPEQNVRHREVDPTRAYGIPRCTAEDLRGGTAEENAAALLGVFQGDKGPHRDAIVLSAALVLEVLEVAVERDAVSLVEAALDNGAVVALLERIRA